MNNMYGYQEENNEDIFFNAPHRSPRMEEIEQQIKRNSRNRANNLSGKFIDITKKPNDEVYAWVQCHSEAVGYTPEHVDEHVEGGWHLVKSSRHPEVNPLTKEDREELASFREELVQNPVNMKPIMARGDRYIRKGRNNGLILMSKNAIANQMAIERLNNESDKKYNSYRPEVFNELHRNDSDTGMRMQVTATRIG